MTRHEFLKNCTCCRVVVRSCGFRCSENSPSPRTPAKHLLIHCNCRVCRICRKVLLPRIIIQSAKRSQEPGIKWNNDQQWSNDTKVFKLKRWSAHYSWNNHINFPFLLYLHCLCNGRHKVIIDMPFLASTTTHVFLHFCQFCVTVYYFLFLYFLPTFYHSLALSCDPLTDFNINTHLNNLIFLGLLLAGCDH